ncbi:MAG: ABC transporter permease [Bacteroidales bacterium]|nr:ABC transporter permease [Bacteroidales bacterium]
MKYRHFKQFLEQLGKNKFFTFLNLFGISIPLMIIMLMILQIDLSIHPSGPEENNDQMLFVNATRIKSSSGGYARGKVHLDIIEKYFKHQVPEETMAFSTVSSATRFETNSVMDIPLRYTNSAFWQVFNFHFLEGRSYTRENVKQGDQVIVISRKIRQQVFDNKKAVGKTLQLNGHTCRVIGVVEDVSSLGRNTYAQVWMPYTLRSNPPFNPRGMGSATGDYTLTFKTTEDWDFQDVREHVATVGSKLNNIMGEDREFIFGGPSKAAEIYFRGYRDPESYSGLLSSYLGVAGKILIILLLPALNLVSLNLTRIQEKSHEIAIRKAFGATRQNLVVRVMLENSVLTLIGGIIGLFMAYGVAIAFKSYIFSSYYVETPAQAIVQMNYSVFFVLILVSLTFSVLSGLIPSMRISRLQPAYVLKGGAL